jgi:hypothetical protein
LFVAVAAVASLLAVTLPGRACPFCGALAGKTLVEEMNDAEIVLYGSFKPGVGTSQETSDFEIDVVIKKNDFLADKKVVTMERYIPGTEKGKKWVVFCSVFKGRVDPYLATLVDAKSGIDKYLAEAVKFQDRKTATAKRLRFYFDYLDNPEPEIANDALKEWSFADYKDYRDMAKDLPADKLAAWLADKKTPSLRHGLYASLLGHCGTKEHAAVLRTLLEDPDTNGMDGILAGLVLLEPKEGWEKVNQIMGNGSTKFAARYAALRTARFFWDNRPDVVTKENIVLSISRLLNQNDIADLVMEDLRKHGEWGSLEQVLALQGKESHNIPIIRRAILRFALSVPAEKDPKGLAKAFVAKVRMADPERVKDCEELLELEKKAPIPSSNP